MTTKYPKNILQAIVLLFIGFISTTPITIPVFALQATSKLNISEDLFNQLIFLLLFTAITFFYYRKNRKQITFKQFWSRGGELRLKTWVLLLLLLFIFEFGINILLSKYIGYHLKPTDNISNPLNMIWMAIGALVLAPFCEEIIFRGMILRGFLSNYSAAKAVIYSAIIFCAIHIYPTLLLGALFLGLFLGYVFYLTKSLLPGMVFHAIANFSALFMGYILFTLHGKSHIEMVYGTPTLWIMLASSAACITIAFFVLKSGKTSAVVGNKALSR